MVKKAIAPLLAVSTLAIAVDAQAQTRGGFEAGVEVLDYGYRERVDGQTVVSDDGVLYGVHLGYTQRLGDGWFVRGRLDVAGGEVDTVSKGSILFDPDAPESRLENISQAMGRLELQVGHDFAVGNGGATVTPFAGIGAWALSDGSGGAATDDGLLGYDREVSYAYVPLGVALRAPLGGRKALTVSTQYNWVVGGEATSFFSGIDPEAPDVTVDIGGGHGFDVSAMLDLPIGGSVLRVGPFFRSWDIDQSESFVIVNPDDPSESIELSEPPNRISQLGVRLAFAF